MKQRPTMRLARATVSLIAAAAWLLASNHCLAACFLPAPAAVASEHEHCGSQQPASDEKPAGDCASSNCCQSLAAPASAVAKSVVNYDGVFFVPKDFQAIGYIVPGEQQDTLIAELDTGPPGGESFAEAVLQRSLLAHAPPVVA